MDNNAGISLLLSWQVALANNAASARTIIFALTSRLVLPTCKNLIKTAQENP
jgi:hypothetical protein